jgi:NAD(P)-dependent dehydrogenase (short-subunit alcohol dehydrogenase family)
MRLENKVVIITGAGSGLGRESALLFSEEGAVVLVTDIVPQRAEDVAHLIQDRGGSATAMTVDVTIESDVARAVDFAVSEHGRLDIMFANAGIRAPGPTAEIDELTESAWDAVMDVNLKGVFLASKHAVRVMKPQRSGAILATSSAASIIAYPGIPAYNASKGGVNTFVKTLAIDLGKYGIRVNALCPSNGMSPNLFLGPGYPVIGKSYEEVETERDGRWNAEDSPIPLKLADPPRLRDNAYAALFLVSEESRYMSGVCLPATDGGLLSKVAMQLPPGWAHQWLSMFAANE